MGPVRNFADKKEVYFYAKVNNIESKVNKDKALLHITLALKYDSNFPSNMFQAQFKLGNWSSEKIPLQKAPDKNPIWKIRFTIFMPLWKCHELPLLNGKLTALVSIFVKN
ncbi:hypothetical protein BIX59_02280 [Mycoplasmoides pneumoniae]|nr:hypothetical protein BIX59_02280 [Mycoplasmoides pneumoniae]